MSDVATLLPNNAGPGEGALEQATARVGAVTVVIDDLWNPEACPASLLPWLAWALSVDAWDPAWTEAHKRDVLAASASVHRKKGTRQAVVTALASAGYGDAEVIEYFGWDFYNGASTHDGSITYAEADHWAEYRIKLARPITIAQADQVRRILGSVAPARAHLKLLDFTEALNLYNNAIVYNGVYTHGVA